MTLLLVLLAIYLGFCGAALMGLQWARTGPLRWILVALLLLAAALLFLIFEGILHRVNG